MTRHLLPILLMLVTGAARASTVVPESPFKAVADRLHSTVIQVRALASLTLAMDDGPQVVQSPCFGTGVLVGGGLAVTTLHTIGAALPGRMAAWSDVEALIPDAAAVPARIVAWYPDLDLAVLRVPDAAAIAAAALSPDTPARGDALIAIGIGDDAINVVGVMVAGASGDQLILSSNRRIDSRYWGGPLFDAQGRLAGIVLASVFPRALNSLALAGLLGRVQAR